MTKVTETQENQLADVKALPNLHEAEVSPRELSSDYWTPEKEGEYKVGIIAGIKEEPCLDQQTQKEIMLECIIMMAQNEDRSFTTVRNGSKRLVATIQNSISAGAIVLGQTPIKIMYTGKVKNKNNSFMSDTWSVKPLIIG